MRKNGVLTYLHGDHLGSTVLETNALGAITADEKYRASVRPSLFETVFGRGKDETHNEQFKWVRKRIAKNER